MTPGESTPSSTPTATSPRGDGHVPKPPARRSLLHRAKVRLRAFRTKVRSRPHWNLAWRTAIGVLGTIVLIVGIIAIPYPGPGWLIVFTGLGILATEFEWAGRVLRFARRYYDRWVAWVKRQNPVVQLLLGLLTFAIVVVTIWLLDGFYLMARIVGLGHWTWLQGPIMA